jgi:hypothetical protein
MRRFIQILFIGLLSLSASTVVAQNGAEVEKGDYLDYWGMEYNPDEGLLYFFSNFSDVCDYVAGGAGGIVLDIPWTIVHRPNDNDDPDFDGKYNEHGFFFIRALMATPGEFWSDPCGVWSNPELIFADGMIHSVLNDNDQWPENTERRNVWGFTANGALEDFGDYCKGEMVGLKWRWRGMMEDDFPACIPECYVKVLNQVGPELKCN